MPILASPLVPRTARPLAQATGRIVRRGPAAAGAAGKAPVVAAAAAPAKPRGADLKMLGLCVGISAAIWLCPHPAGLSAQAWHLFAIFVGDRKSVV